MVKRILVSLLGAAAFALVAAQPAAAETITFNVCNTAGASYRGHTSLTTTLVGGQINVVLNEIGPGDFGIFGDDGKSNAFGFNLLGAGTPAGFAVINEIPRAPSTMRQARLTPERTKLPVSAPLSGSELGNNSGGGAPSCRCLSR